MHFLNWSLARKAGQLVVGGFNGKEITGEVRKLVQHYHIGGVILFNRSIESPAQLRVLTGSLQELAKSGNEDWVPLLIAVDQEGGSNIHVKEGITLTPGNMAMGAAGDAEGVYRMARISGKELRALGINVNYAPDMDVNNNPMNPVIGIRSYGEDPHLVARLGAAAIRGYQESGIAATAKHFPGHGDTRTDSHLDLPVIPYSMERLEKLELIPFKAAIEAGVDLMMTAHIVFSELEPEGVPATLSNRVVTGLLREKLQYDGVITTDCLEMKAIHDNYGTAEGAVRAIEAGVDMVLVSHTFTEQVKAIEAIIQAVRTGRISEERINRSLGRILNMKKRRNMWNVEIDLEQANKTIELPESAAAVRELVGKSITMVKEGGVLPLNPEQSILVVRVKHQLHMGGDDPTVLPHTLVQELRSYCGNVTEIVVGSNPSDEEINTAMKVASQSDQVIVQTSNTLRFPSQGIMVRKLVENHERVVAVSVRNPYDLNAFPQVKTYIACYEDLPITLELLAEILIGNKKASGKLPVTLETGEH